MILGIVGLSRLGREGLREHFSEAGFWYVSLLDEIREMAREHGLVVTPGQLLQFELQTRARMGATFFLQRALSRLRGKHAIIDHLRHPEEIQELRKLPHALVVGLYAPTELKTERELRALRQTHMRQFNLQKSYLDSPEETLSDLLETCLQRVDVSTPFDTGPEEFYARLDEALEDLQLRAKEGPSFI